MKLYIGNATKQFQDFTYRLPESPGPRTQRIAPGGQVRLSGELSTAEVDAVIEQHTKYGLTKVEDIDRAKNFTGLCYSLDKSIPVDKLMRAMRKNTEILIQRGKEIRKEAAVAENNRLEQSLEESGRPEGLRGLEMSIVEENHDDASETPAISEGVRVTRDANEDPGAPGARQRGGRSGKRR